jgi:hypothetical protein
VNTEGRRSGREGALSAAGRGREGEWVRVFLRICTQRQKLGSYRLPETKLI